MSLEENKTTVRRLIEALNKKDLALLDELMAPNYVDHTHQIQGLERLKHLIEEEMKSFPDFHVHIEDIIAEGDKVWVRLKETATHTGEFHGLAPTGKNIAYTAVAIWHIVDGKVAEGWEVYDLMDYYTQLGVVEYKGFPGEIK